MVEKYMNCVTTDIETWAVAIKDKYLISDMGRIKNIKSGYICDGRTWGKNKQGRKYFQFYVKGKTIKYDVAKLVAERFIPNPNKYKHVGFKNGIYCDAEVTNIEWITKEEYYSRRTSSKRKVIKYKNDRQVKIYKSIKEAAEQNNINYNVLKAHMYKKEMGGNIEKTHYNDCRYEYYKESKSLGNKNAG